MFEGRFSSSKLCGNIRIRAQILGGQKSLQILSQSLPLTRSFYLKILRAASCIPLVKLPCLISVFRTRMGFE